MIDSVVFSNVGLDHLLHEDAVEDLKVRFALQPFELLPFSERTDYIKRFESRALNHIDVGVEAVFRRHPAEHFHITCEACSDSFSSFAKSPTELIDILLNSKLF